MKRALELDPLSFPISDMLGYHYLAARRYDEALEQNRRTYELHGKSYWGHWRDGQIYLEQGAYATGITELQMAVSGAGDDLRPKGWLGYGYALAGRTNEALAILDELEKLSQRRYVSPYIRAVVYLGLRYKDRLLRGTRRSV